MTMVERMARAMKPTTARLVDSLVRAGADRNEAAKLLPLDEALAALRELREPTEAMAEAGDKKYWELDSFSEAIAAAIDAEIAAHEASQSP